MNSQTDITQDQIAEQLELERSQISQGLKRLRDQTFKLEQQNYSSASIYGVSSIDTLLPHVVKRIEDTNTKIHQGKYGAAFKDIHQYLSNIEALAAAAIACKVTFDNVFGYKDKCNTATNICSAIGKSIEDECQMRHYEENAPALLKTLKDNYWHRAIGTQQKLVVIRTLMNRYNVTPWAQWGTSIRTKLGGWLLDCIMDSSGWFYKQRLRVGRKTTVYIVPTAEFMDIKDEVMANAELFSPLAWPMLVPPKDWTNTEPGGYILNEVMQGHELVRRGDHALIQGEIPLSFLNKIQQVKYRLNPFVVNTATLLEERGVSVGKFLPIVHYDLPPKPVDIAENKESRKKYRREAAEVMNKRAAEFKRSCRTRMTMEAVARFKDREFYIPWSFDYRGRAYPIPAFLTPQDTDFGKSLLNFADAAVMTEDAEEWLAFQVATTYGLDKATMQERLDWTRTHVSLIARVARNPIDHLGDWEGADEPWLFLAACEEYDACCLRQTRNLTSLPVATDATCSGLQILAGLARDKSTARLVNVVPSDKPQDAYAVVAEVSCPYIPEKYRAVWDRKCVKRTVMTIPYNAKAFSNRSYIKAALEEKGVDVDKDDLTIIVQSVRQAMQAVVPGPMSVMRWIESEVGQAIKRGEDHIEWTTPSGFLVRQRYFKKKIERIQLQLLGRCDLSIAVEDGKDVDINRHKAATAPNLIHSLDASLLHLAVRKFDEPIALIHDSVLSRACDMGKLSAIIRETYMILFAEHDYLRTFALYVGAETEPPIIGDLQPETVIESTYFFC
nr:DNA-directed RNA polymerase [uncultured Mediterranean phage uvMED]